LTVLGAALATIAAEPMQAPGVIEGRVLDADGRPVRGALVSAWRPGSGVSESVVPSGTANTDRDGRFRVEQLLPGTYGASATVPGRAAAQSVALTVESGKPTAAGEIRLGRDGRTLRGRLRDVRGSPVRGADVVALVPAQPTWGVFRVVAGKDGRYSITLPRGKCLLVAESGGLSSTMTQVPDEASGSVDLALFPAPEGPPPPAVASWLREKAVRLATTEAGHGFEDMKPLRAIVGDARLVALGEATHGTREFFQLKHRMLEYLATELGFTVFAIEASLPDAIAVDDYVVNGIGDPTLALAGLGFWTWNTEEVLGLIRWMRSFNEDPNHERKLRFYGFDMQNTPAAVARLRAYFETVDPESAPKIGPLVEPLDSPMARTTFVQLTDEKKKATLDGIESVRRRLEEHRESYVAAAGRKAWDLAVHLADVLRQGADNLAASSQDFSVRDRAMAENVAWILGHEPAGTRAVLWAHNGHVSFGEAAMMGAPSMGWNLRGRYETDLVVFGFAFDRGSFQAVDAATGQTPGLRRFTVGSAPKESLEAALAATGASILAVDLRKAPATGPVADWLRIPRPARSIGATFSEGSESKWLIVESPRTSYDALLFVADTTAARANPGAWHATDTVPRAALGIAPTNLDFESSGPDGLPSAWRFSKPSADAGYSFAMVAEGAHSGKRAARLSRDSPPDSARFGNLMQTVDATPYRGRKVRLRGWVRVDVRGPWAHAQLWLRVDRDGGSKGFFNNMGDRPIISSEWAAYEIVGEVADDAVTLNFGMLFVGKGAAFIDDVSIETLSDETTAK